MRETPVRDQPTETPIRSIRPNRHFRRKENHPKRKERRNKFKQTLLSKYVVNLSNTTLSHSQISLLSKGLKFSPNQYAPPDFNEAIVRLTRSSRIYHHFRGNDDDADIDTDTPELKKPPFTPKSTWNPPAASADIETYLRSLKAQLDNITQLPHLPNLCRAEWQAARELACSGLVIKQADKGSSIVVESKQDYVKAGLEHLASSTIYKQIENDPTEPLSVAINTLIQQAHRKGWLSDDMRNYLRLDVCHVRVQQAYFLKKLHKDPIAVRSIVSGVGGPTEAISSFLDYYMQPHVLQIKSYVRDSASLIRLLEETQFPTDISLVTIDVKALYLNIPHHEGVQVCLDRLYGDNADLDPPPFPKSLAQKLMETVLKHNYFEFNGTMYRQIQGTAMGTKMAPSFACLFMANLEESFLRDRPHSPLMWLRYIDDIFCVWPHSGEALSSFLEDLDHSHSVIKYTHEVSQHSVVFLDTEIHKGTRFNSDGILDVRPHFKDTNSFQYLHYSSCHPRALFKGLVLGELKRILRASSDTDTFHRASKLLLHHFQARGYPHWLLTKAASEVTYASRRTLLYRPASLDKKTPIPFVVRYNQTVPSSQLRSALAPPPSLPTPTLCYSGNKNISHTLVRARLPGSPHPPKATTTVNIPLTPTFRGSSTPCGTPCCRCCPIMSKREAVYIDSAKTVTLPRANCSSSVVVYLLECTLCKHQRARYVGQTCRPLHTRMAGHRAALASGKNTPLYTHLRKRDHSFQRVRVSVLEQVADPKLLLAVEEAWIQRLKTRVPNGLNSKYN